MNEIFEGVLLGKDIHNEDRSLIAEFVAVKSLREVPVLGIKSAQCPIKNCSHSAIVDHDVPGLDIAMSEVNLMVVFRQ